MAKKNFTMEQLLDGLALHLSAMSDSDRNVASVLLPILAKDPAFSGKLAAMLNAMVSHKDVKREPAKLYELKAHQSI